MSPVHGIVQGDVLASLRDLPSNEFDAVLSDPPYGFSFMGKKWDYDVPSVEVFRELLRVLKPGGLMLTFGGARTSHRMTCNIEDAGFEIRDVLMWLYGKGFPKSLNVGLAIDKAAGATREVVGTRTLTGNAAYVEGGHGFAEMAQGKRTTGSKAVDVTAPATPLAKQWDGYGTALKPAYEPIILARKPLDGTVAANVAKWGTGALAIDACRIDGAGDKPTFVRSGGESANAYGDGLNRSNRTGDRTDEGRWPANLLLDEDAGAELDASVAPTKSVPYRENAPPEGAVLPLKARTAGGYADAGGPSRFFYCAKVSTKEREAGCAALPQRTAGEMTESAEDGARLESPRTGAGRTGGARNHHPTLKPIALTRWLASLVKPPTEGAQLLVPYSGAGSEMIGALLAGWPLVFGIEGEAEYVEIANARIADWVKT